MYILLAASLVILPLLHAATPECEDALAFEADRHGVYFDRWQPGLGRDLQTLLLEAINVRTDRGRPLLILDTNPNPELWGPANLVPPSADARFPGRAYADLGDDRKAELFAEFTDRLLRGAETAARPILIVDHHFDSDMLLEASTTPLVVDYLNWLNSRAPTDEIRRAREIWRTAQILRDHSDADVVLATLAASMIDDRRGLARRGAFLADIARFNDHAELPESIDPTRRRAILIGYALLRAFEEFIPARRPGGFETALELLPDALDQVETFARQAWSDPVRAFLGSDPGAGTPAEMRKVFAMMSLDWTRENDLSTRVRNMIHSGEGVCREGPVLVLDFPPGPEAASGLSLVRLLRALEAPVLEGARVLVAVTRENSHDGTLTFVKLRALKKGVRFDDVLAQIRARGLGGGGRGTAAGLYASCGKRVSPATLAGDLAWLVDRLARSQGVSGVQSE